MSELEKLLKELRNMKSSERKKHIENNKETWSKIGSKNSEAAGFEDEAELNAWLEQNDYSALG